MAFPKIAAHDAKTFTQRLFERVRKDDGGAFSVFDPAGSTSYAEFVKSVRTVRDAAGATDALARNLDGRVTDHEARIAALEVAPPPARPFP